MPHTSRDQPADDVELRALVHRYADAAPRRDPAGVAATFIADGVWRADGLGRHEGRAALVSFFTAMLGDWSVHPSPAFRRHHPRHGES